MKKTEALFLAVLFIVFTAPTWAKNNSNQGRGMERRSQVAQFVHQLLESTPSGGIGRQVRQIARLQNQDQQQIEENLNQIESRPVVFKKIFGYHKKAIKNMERLFAQNQDRLTYLRQLAPQIQDQSDQQKVEDLITGLQEQQTQLNNLIDQEKQFKGIWGWLKNLFAK